MKKLKIFLILNFMFALLASCGVVKEGFSNQKKNNSDEFLVEKKSPLLMPPNFNELPVPNSENILNKSEKAEIKNLITNSENDISGPKSSENIQKNFEDLLLDKIKNN
tara:strand:+ start:54 stop:377 length:324 start_codon:yes stop_codon:yes gene_type:complete